MPNLALVRFFIRHTLLESRRVDKLKAQNPGVDVDALISLDPSPTKKYLPWIVKQVKSGAKPEDLGPTVSFFDTNPHKFKSKDINAYKSLKELENEVKEAETKRSKGEQRRITKGQAPVIYEDDDLIVLRPDTKEACVQYGKQTKWCITMRDASYYEQYTGANVIFYYVLRKEPRGDPLDKIAFAVQRDTNNKIVKIEAFNAKDENRGPTKIVPRNVYAAIKADAVKRPKAFLAKLKQGTHTIEELKRYWKTLPKEGKITVLTQVKSNREWRGLLSVEKDDEFRDVIADLIDGTAKVENNAIVWYRDGQLHRDAVIRADGTQIWYRDGQFHRENGPAVIHADGTQIWYRDGQFHRENGPAVIYADGTQEWYRDGKMILPPK